MNILRIYEKYNIMPQLQEHQLRVAAVAKLICDSFARGNNAELVQPLNNAEGEVDRDNIIGACLLHDMGNIIKFDFGRTKELLNQDLDLGYWQKVKDEYIKKYGNDAHQAALLIARELGVSKRILELVDCVSFHKGQANAVTEDFGKKICAYSDMRVEPRGVASLEERFVGLRHRYQKHREGTDQRDQFESGLRAVEKQIFEKTKIKPEDINNDSIRKRMEALKIYKI